MVESLINLYNAVDNNRETIEYGLNLFSCKKDPELETFIKKKSIDFELMNLSRTFILFNNTSTDIDGFFSLSIRTLVLDNSISSTKKKLLSKHNNVQYVSGFLIGQLARNDNAAKGTGKKLVLEAIKKIKEAQINVAGRFIYLDCKSCLQFYYESLGFTFLQKNKNNADYIQMYSIL